MEYKVIFHIDENARWQMLLGNVENLLGALGSGPWRFWPMVRPYRSTLPPFRDVMMKRTKAWLQRWHPCTRRA